VSFELPIALDDPHDAPSPATRGSVAT
jgi:hypothetical protein